MRGALIINKATAGKVRIIPADAGSTTWPCCPKRSLKDHPRGCGEHIDWTCLTSRLQGSSPRMRGAPRSLLPLLDDMRIIPADAGSTQAVILTRTIPEDHPRGCGEHAWLTADDLKTRGSSPRMRGAQIPDSLSRGLPGIIPADAGSTL